MSGAPNRGPWNEPLAGDNNVKAGGTDNSNNNNNGGNQQQQQQPGNKDNTTIDDAAVEDIWKDIVRENSGAELKPGDAGYVAPQVDTRTQEQRVADYLKTQGLEAPTLTPEDQEKAKNGDFSGVLSAMATLAQQSHLKAIQSSDTLINAKVEAAFKKMEGNTRSLMSGDKALTMLNEKLPFTKDKAIGPVAQTVMQRFIDRNATPEQAIEGVRKWFEHTLKAADPNYKKPNTNLNGSFRGDPGQNASDAETNWMDILSPKSK